MREKLSIVFLTAACVSTAIAWLTSYPAAAYYLPSRPTNGGWRARSTAGQLEIYHYASPQAGLRAINDAPGAWQPSQWSGLSVDEPILFGQIVVERGAYWTANSTTTHHALQLRYSLLAFVFGSLLIAQCIRVRQFHRRQTALARGLCAGCGYDLRATPGRCPECGKFP